MEEMPIDRPEPSAAQRPALLTVLCILTWVGSAAAIALELYVFFAMKGLAARFGVPVSFISRSTIICTLVCTSSLLCTTGSLFMWKLRRVGFRMYVAGQLLQIFVCFYVLATGPRTPWLYIAEAIAGVFFMALYSRCRNYLQAA